MLRVGELIARSATAEDKMELLVKNGRPAVGRARGYIPASQSDTGQIEIQDEQAATVRQIFE